MYLLFGILLGWITKIPFLIKWYRDLKIYKKKKIELYNKIINDIHKLPINEQSKHWISAKYFKDTE